MPRAAQSLPCCLVGNPKNFSDLTGFQLSAVSKRQDLLIHRGELGERPVKCDNRFLTQNPIEDILLHLQPSN